MDLAQRSYSGMTFIVSTRDAFPITILPPMPEAANDAFQEKEDPKVNQVLNVHALPLAWKRQGAVQGQGLRQDQKDG